MKDLITVQILMQVYRFPKIIVYCVVIRKICFINPRLHSFVVAHTTLLYAHNVVIDWHTGARCV